MNEDNAARSQSNDMLADHLYRIVGQMRAIGPDYFDELDDAMVREAARRLKYPD